LDLAQQVGDSAGVGLGHHSCKTNKKPILSPRRQCTTGRDWHRLLLLLGDCAYVLTGRTKHRNICMFVPSV